MIIQFVMLRPYYTTTTTTIACLNLQHCCHDFHGHYLLGTTSIAVLVVIVVVLVACFVMLISVYVLLQTSYNNSLIRLTEPLHHHHRHRQQLKSSRYCVHPSTICLLSVRKICYFW